MGRATQGCCGKRHVVIGTPEAPAVFGSPTDDLVRVRAVAAVGGFERGQEGWATGTTLEANVARGNLVRL